MNKPPVITPSDIKLARAALKMTQKEFAKAIGTSQQRVSVWELGTTPQNAWQRCLHIYFKEHGVSLVQTAV
jgi:Predicted transcriptional regulator